MADKIRVRRGNRADLPTLSVGEPGFCTDTRELFFGSSAGNIQFARTSDLPAYEIGTFTPVFDFSGVNGAHSYTLQRGRYTRIGNRCICDIAIIGSVGSGSTGDFRIGGLPFTPVNINNNTAAGTIARFNGITLGSAYTGVLVGILTGSSVIRPRQFGSGVDDVAVSSSNLGATVEVTVNFSYEIN